MANIQLSRINICYWLFLFVCVPETMLLVLLGIWRLANQDWRITRNTRLYDWWWLQATREWQISKVDQSSQGFMVPEEVNIEIVQLKADPSQS